MVTVESVKNMPREQLVYLRQELTEVTRNQEAMIKAGFTCPKLGCYWDELHAVVGELYSRRQRRKANRAR